MRPMLRELARAIDEALKTVNVVGAKSRPQDEVMRRDEHVDEVELQNLERIEHAPKVAAIRLAAWPRPVEPGSRHCDASRLGLGEANPGTDRHQS